MQPDDAVSLKTDRSTCLYLVIVTERKDLHGVLKELEFCDQLKKAYLTSVALVPLDPHRLNLRQR